MQTSNYVMVISGFHNARGKEKHLVFAGQGTVWNLGEEGGFSKEWLKEQKDFQVPWGQQSYKTVNTLTL